MYNTNQN